MAEKRKDLTAEQQLLELIEKKNSSSAVGDSDASAGVIKEDVSSSIRQRKTPLFSLEVIKSRIEFFRNAINGGLVALKGAKDVDISMDIANNVLILAICVLFFFLGFEIISKPTQFQQTPDMIGLKKKAAPVKVEQSKEKELQFFIDKMKNRDLFALKPKVVEQKVVEEVIVTTPLDDFFDDVKLVGISPSTGEDISFVMVESKKAETTIFLEEGDVVDEVYVKQILPDRVLLSFKEETRELR